MAIEQIRIRPDLTETLVEDARQSAQDVNDLANEAIEIYLRERQRRKIDREIEAYVGMHKDLWERIPGQWVAIHNGELVDQDTDMGALYQRVRERYGRTSVLIRQVKESPEEVIWWRTPSTGKLAK